MSNLILTIDGKRYVTRKTAAIALGIGGVIASVVGWKLADR
jgi:hypothetical protein